MAFSCVSAEVAAHPLNNLLHLTQAAFRHFEAYRLTRACTGELSCSAAIRTRRLARDLGRVQTAE
jgi:hypothetical protein